MDLLETDLTKFDKDTLLQLRTKVEEALETVEERRREEALAAMAKAAEAAGFTMEELMGKKKSNAGKPHTNKRAPIKYQNPDKGQQHWTGKGRRPDWFKEKIAAGVPESELLYQPKNP